MHISFAVVRLCKLLKVLQRLYCIGSTCTLRFKGAGSVSYGEARHKRRLPGTVIKGAQGKSCWIEFIHVIVHTLTLNLQLDSVGDGIGVINWFMVVWNIFLVMLWWFAFRDFGAVVYTNPCLAWWPFPQTWSIFMSPLHDKISFSTFQVPF